MLGVILSSALKVQNIGAVMRQQLKIVVLFAIANKLFGLKKVPQWNQQQLVKKQRCFAMFLSKHQANCLRMVLKMSIQSNKLFAGTVLKWMAIRIFFDE